ncbi:hypothetical protein OAF16_01145 [Flavobacteriales bacterium]|nr:hypothetical protein [Flavobacteriales bacterium]
MSNPNIYELMKVSKELDHLAKEPISNTESESANVGLWILGGVLVFGLIYYLNNENTSKENQDKF